MLTAACAQPPPEIQPPTKSQRYSLLQTRRRSGRCSESEPAGQRWEHGDRPRTGCCCCWDSRRALPWEQPCTHTRSLSHSHRRPCPDTMPPHRAQPRGRKERLMKSCGGMSHGCCQEPMAALTSCKTLLTWKPKGLSSVGQCRALLIAKACTAPQPNKQLRLPELWFGCFCLFWFLLFSFLLFFFFYSPSTHFSNSYGTDSVH